jgi:glycosyltransferase involved in cell wall biosynthesis
MVKVLQLISSGGFFGAENVMLQLASELAIKGQYYPVAGVIENLGNPHIEVAEKCREQGIETAVFPCRGKFDRKTIAQIRKFIKKNEIGIIHSHGYKSNLYSFFASLGLSTNLVATCHNWLGDDSKMKLYASLDRFILRRFNNIIAVSEPVKKRVIDSGVPFRKVGIVQNGISLDRFDPMQRTNNVRSALGISDDRIVIGSVGRLSAEKGHGNLLSISNDIVEKHPKCVFLIVGDGILKQDLQREYDFPFVIFTGARNDVHELYRCMDIFVLPSLTEGLPMVLLEAMASKLPIIASNVGAIPTVIKNGSSGLLVEPGDTESLKKSLLYLLENPEKAKKLGQKANQTVNENFSSSKMADEYTNIYNKLSIAAQACG